MLRVLLFGLFIYMFYKLLFDFIIPIYKATRQVRKGFGEMKNKMNEHNQQQGSDKNKPGSSAPKQPVGDYIDFEEIK